MINALTASFLSLIVVDPDVPPEVSNQATTQLASGIPFISDQDLVTALDESALDEQTTDAILEDYCQARLEGLRTALSLLAVFAVIALYFTRRIPDRPPGSARAPNRLSGRQAPGSFPESLVSHSGVQGLSHHGLRPVQLTADDVDRARGEHGP